ncbi:MAG: DUF1569 domain-containing protein [Gemmatimonadales bacterium]
MKSLYHTSDTAEIQGRIAALTSDRQPLWGKMNVGQAMAHCVIGLESATGDRHIKRVLIGRVLGPMVKPLALGDDKPMKKNSPTAPELRAPTDSNFASEREKLTQLVTKFASAGPTACTRAPHAFFGPMTPDEWGILMYKHLDHHLRQFGA